MKNLNQVTIIQNALAKERDKLMGELQKISLYIKKKQESLKKVLAYQREYSEGTHLDASRSVPVLHKNLDSFTKKINVLVRKEEMEIDNLLKMRTSKLKEIEVMTNKVSVMEKFSATIKTEKLMKQDNIEQMSLEEIALNKRTRGDHE